MVLSGGRRSVLLLGVAVIFFCLTLLTTTSSGAQTTGQDQNRDSATSSGADECVEFEDQNTGDQQTSQNTDVNTDTQQQDQGNSIQRTQDTGQSSDQQSQQTQDTGNIDQRASQNGNDSSTNTDTQQSQDQGDSAQRTQDTGQNSDQQSQQTGNESTDDQQASQEEGDVTTSTDAEGTGADECVVADTVPDESLPPTGVPVKSQADKPTAKKEKKKSGRAKKLGSRNEAQEKSNSSQTQERTNSSQTQEKSNSSQTHKKSKSTQTQKRVNSGEKQNKPNGSATLEYRGEKIEDRSGKEPRQEELKSSSKSAAMSDLAPVLASNWPLPSSQEVASTDKPRRFGPDPGAEMTLSARALGIYDVPVTSSDRPEDLDKGLIRVPETSSLGDPGNQRNVYIAGHYLGPAESKSRLAFYNLHTLENGDELVLKDGLGQSYKYRVSEKFAVGPEAAWGMGQVRNRDMVTLQTCIPPDFGKRLLVRADRVK